MPEAESARPFRVLLVEDSPSDVRLLREALKDSHIDVQMTTVDDGVQAMEYLAGMLGGAQPRPDLIILDLNLPRKSGREVLAEVKSDARLTSLPILVMTTSNADEDISFAFSYDADSFITKPTVLPEYIRIVRAIEEFWSGSEKLSAERNSRFPQFEPHPAGPAPWDF